MRIVTLLLVGCATSPLEGAAIDIADDFVPSYADGNQSPIIRIAVPCDLDGLGGSFRGTAMTVVPGDCPTLEIDPTSVTPTTDVIEVHDATTTIVVALGAALLDVRQVEMADTLCGGQSVTATWSHLADLGETEFAFSVPTKGAGVPRPGSSGAGQVRIFLENAEMIGSVDCAPATCNYHFRHPAITTGRYVATCP